MARKVIWMMMVAAFCVSLSACGRKTDPVAPDDVDPRYPRSYPAPTAVPGEPRK